MVYVQGPLRFRVRFNARVSCLTEGVHLRLATEGKMYLSYLLPNICTYIEKYYFKKSLRAYC